MAVTRPQRCSLMGPTDTSRSASSATVASRSSVIRYSSTRMIVRVDRQLGRREGEDEPARACIDVREPERVPEE